MGNTPNECLFVCELFSIFVTSSVIMRSADILKVFSHCPYMKMWKFSKEKGWTNGTHFLFRYWQGCVLRPYIPISIQVWGIASSFIFAWVRHNLLKDKRNQLQTFFLRISRRIGVVRQ